MSKSDNKRQFQAVVSVLRFELEITTIAVMSALVFGVVGFSIGFILLFAGLLLAIPLVVIYAFALLDNANAESYFRQWTIGAGALNIFFAFILWLFGVIEVNDQFMSVDKKCLVPVESVCVRTPLMNEKSESVSVEFPTSSTTLSPGKLPRVLKHYKSSTTITSENKSVPEKSQHPTANELLMNDLDTPNQSVTSINEPIEMSSKR
ncbi:hypothetical protein M3Y98_00829200 [Aphelenchoides besseyi]|nr:hypothetical protein M3Y98_00829200 [Aphelenchoides besseyi]